MNISGLLINISSILSNITNILSNGIEHLYRSSNILSNSMEFLYIPPKILLLGYSIYLIIFSIYLETSPKLTNIWLRKDSNNIIRFRPAGILSMLMKPFSNIFFWYPSLWDINYYVGGYIFTLILTKVMFRYNYA